MDETAGLGQASGGNPGCLQDVRAGRLRARLPHAFGCLEHHALTGQAWCDARASPPTGVAARVPAGGSRSHRRNGQVQPAGAPAGYGQQAPGPYAAQPQPYGYPQQAPGPYNPPQAAGPYAPQQQPYPQQHNPNWRPPQR